MQCFMFFFHTGMCFFIQSSEVYVFNVPEANTHVKVSVRTRIIVEKRGGTFTWRSDYVWKWNQVLFTSGKNALQGSELLGGSKDIGFLSWGSGVLFSQDKTWTVLNLKIDIRLKPLSEYVFVCFNITIRNFPLEYCIIHLNAWCFMFILK